MSVLAFNTDDLFRITIVKYHVNNPDRKWGNNYELQATADGVTSDLVTAATRLVDMEEDLHFDNTRFDRVRISTWEPDSVPYDPTVFVSLPLSSSGNRPTSGIELNAINVCWHVARFPLSGRFGSLYYRNALSESDTIAPAGRTILASPSGMATTLGDAVDDSNTSTMLEGTGVPFNLVMINEDGTQVRPIISLVSRGVAHVPFDHAWFNRTPAP